MFRWRLGFGVVNESARLHQRQQARGRSRHEFDFMYYCVRCGVSRQAQMERPRSCYLNRLHMQRVAKRNAELAAELSI